MRIEKAGADIHRSEAARAAQSPADPTNKKDSRATENAVQREDRVQISDAGRALAARHADEIQASQHASSLSADRIAEIRQRILSGAYDSVEIVDQVARRMLERGDI